ncbi:MAG: hypothetical protein ACJ75R_10260 [Solirubrobacterales bacterium]
MSIGDYLVGLIFLLVTYGSVATATEIVVRRRLGHLHGAVRLIAWSMLATAGLLIVFLVPGAMTILSRESALVAALLMLAIVAGLVEERRSPRSAGEPVRSPSSSRAEVLVAVAAVAAAGLWLVYTLFRYRTHAPLGFDAAGAYLPTAARWLQLGSIWEISDWVPNAFYGSGPGNGSVIVLSAMLPWNNDFIAHFAMYPYVVLLAVTLYALGRELGAPAAVAAVLAPMLVAAPDIVQPALADGLLDPVMYAGFAAGVLFLLRHARTGARADLLLAGLALGISFGTKFYGYTSVTALVFVWVIARLAARVRPGVVARQALTVGALILAAGGIWMVRDWIATGNPLMPVQIDLLGTTIFDAPPDPQAPLFGFTLLSYLDQPGVWVDTLAHQFRIAIGFPLLVLAGAVAAAGAMLVVRARRRLSDRLDAAALAVLAATVVETIVYMSIPYTAAGPAGDPIAAVVNVRYGIPAAILAVAVAGWLAARIGPRWRLALCVAALLAMIDALRVGPVNAPSAAYVCLLLGLGVAAAVALLGVRRPTLRLPAWGPRVLVAIGVAVLVIGAIAGQVLQRAYNDDRYLGGDQALDCLIENSEHPRTVGLAGFWSLDGVLPIYPSFGTRLQNRVEFVGRVVDDALLRRFDARAPFLDELGQQDPDMLIVGRDVPSEFDPDHDRPLPPDAELTWARSAGYREVARSDRFVLLRRSRS